MSSFTEALNFIAALGSLALGVFAIVLLTTHVIYRKEKNTFLDSAVKWFMWFGMGVTGLSILLSMIYSSVIGYAPCVLCWWQRVLIYPQFVLYAVALYAKDTKIYKYTFTLSIVGLIFSLYHNYLDFGGGAFIACSAGVSCTMRYVNEFGFVTIPLMSFISLLSLAIIAWIGIKRS